MKNWGSAPRLLGAALMTVGISVLVADSASAQIERNLAGIRLNSTSKSVLQKFGNPHEIVIGDVGVRAPNSPQGGQGVAMGGQAGAMMGGGPRGAMMGGAGMMGLPGGAPAGMAGMMGGQAGAMMGGGPRGAMMGGQAGAMTGGPGGGPPGGMMAAMMAGRPGGAGGMAGAGFRPGGTGGRRGNDGDDGMGMAAMGGGGPRAGMVGGFGGAAGMNLGGGASAFGATTSTLAQQQEVTWIYNKKFKDAKGEDNIVSYEFLIGADGRVAQIRALGYSGGGIRTQRGVVLGSTYRDVIRLYGYPEEHIRNGDILVCTYKNRAHVQFQFMNAKNANNPFDAGNRVIAITIASIE